MRLELKTSTVATFVIRPFVIGLFVTFALLLTGTLGIDNAYAGRKKSKKNLAGNLDKQTYTDSEYGFKITFAEGWKPSVKKKGGSLRVTGAKKDYTIPTHFRNSEFHTTIPVVKVYVDTTSLKLRAFIDSLKSDSYNSKQMQAIAHEFKVLDGKYRRPRVSRLKLENGLKGKRMTTTRKYVIQVQKEGRTDANVVTEYIKGEMAFFKKDDRIYIISCVCESLYYDVNQPIFDEMINSFALLDESPAEPTKD